jgi:alkylation response protein AidB-like acyl-CoA dehydrogenase
MNLAYAPDDDAFRRTLCAWLAAHVPEAKSLPSSPADAVERSRAWQRTLHAAGYVGLAWPREYGGQAASPVRQVIFGEEYARAGAPPLLNGIGINILGPALIRHGSDQQKRHFLPRILAADDIWCQGFSEPGAGSDLASLRTRGVLDGDDLVVTGQKVWTSLGEVATWCFLLVRTDPEAAPQRGISYVLMDMRSPGVRVVPIRQLTGKRHFSELFLDEVRIPRSQVVGALHDGWSVARATLDAERSGLAGVVELERHLAGLRTLAGARGSRRDPCVRQRLAALHVEMEALRYTGYRVLTRQMRGAPPGPESAIGKLAASEFRRRIMDTALELEGPFAAIGRGNPQALERGRWQGLYLDARAYTIGGGTSEIMRNIIAERALGLPRSTP